MMQYVDRQQEAYCYTVQGPNNMLGAQRGGLSLMAVRHERQWGCKVRIRFIAVSFSVDDKYVPRDRSVSCQAGQGL